MTTDIEPPLQLVDAAGHPVTEGSSPDGTPCWIHVGPPIRDCPAVLALLELRSFPHEDDFHVPWTERGWRQLPFEAI
jgi:hypothetical protein